MDSTQQKKSTSTKRMRKHCLKVALNPQKAEVAREKDRLRKAAAHKNSVKTADEGRLNESLKEKGKDASVLQGKPPNLYSKIKETVIMVGIKSAYEEIFLK